MTQQTYDNTNRGSLFVNDRKETDKHPDFSGSINVDGKDYWLNGWKKTSNKSGNEFFSLSVKEKTGAAPQKAGAPAAEGAGYAEDVPF